MYLVTGVTGNVGAEVAATLVAENRPVRGVVRAQDGAVPEGVEAVVGDLNRPDSLRDALDGVEGLFLLPGYDGAAELLAAARSAGVERLVQLSGASAGSRDLTNAVTAYMVAAEDTAVASGLGWTILRPSAFMSNTLRWRDQMAAGDDIRLPFAGVRTAMIDPADIAAVAARALTSDRHSERIYRLSGPQSLLPSEQVAIVAAEIGRPLRMIAQSDDEARADMSTQMPQAYVDAFFDFYVTGSLDESPVLDTVSEITGREPRTLRDWVRAHRTAFDTPASSGHPEPSPRS